MRIEILKKIKKKKFTVSIIGLGYIGLPVALSFAKKNIKVIGIDKDITKIKKLKNSISYINTVDQKLIKSCIKKGNLFFSNNYNGIGLVDVIIICVPTPIKKNRKPNMEYVQEAVKKISNKIKKGQIIILECTTYPGTSEKYFLPIFNKKKFTVGKNIFLGYSPEREDPGNKKYSVLKGNINKIVSGYSRNCLTMVNEVYKFITKKTYKVSNIKTAEFTKLLENIYRSVNIGLVNELNHLCVKLGINIYESIEAAKSKPFGYQAFYPGPGVGGHCIPADPYYLSWIAEKKGIKTDFIKLAGNINRKRPSDVSNYIKKQKVHKILLLGLSYKDNSDDLRDAPSIKIYNNLKKTKKIFVCDPCVDKEEIRKSFKKATVKDLKNLNKNFLSNIDLLVILNKHKEINYKLIKSQSKLILDCKNVFKKKYENVLKV